MFYNEVLFLAAMTDLCIHPLRRAQWPGHRGRSHERPACSGERQAERQVGRLWLQQTGRSSGEPMQQLFLLQLFEIGKIERFTEHG